MRSVFLFAQTVLLLIVTSIYASYIGAAPTATPRHVIVRCIALRVRVDDVDALGINFGLIPSDRSTAAPNLRFASVADSAHSHMMFDLLTGASLNGHYSACAAPIVTVTDGQPGVLSFANMKDPGLADKPWLSVIPHVQADGSITLFVAPQFKFVRIPSLDGKKPSESTEAFSFRQTVPDGGTIAFTEMPAPQPRAGQQNGPMVIKSISGHIIPSASTELWVFLTATVVQDAPPENSVAQPNILIAPVYQSKWLQVEDTRPRENRWMIEGGPMDLYSVYRSLDSPSLLDWVARLPEGTCIDYHRSGLPIIAGVHTPEDSIPGFAKYCRDRHIEFTDAFPVL